MPCAHPWAWPGCPASTRAVRGVRSAPAPPTCHNLCCTAAKQAPPRARSARTMHAHCTAPSISFSMYLAGTCHDTANGLRCESSPSESEGSVAFGGESARGRQAQPPRAGLQSTHAHLPARYAVQRGKEGSWQAFSQMPGLMHPAGRAHATSVGAGASTARMQGRGQKVGVWPRLLLKLP